MASERARPRAPPFIDPPGYARHRPEETLLYQLVAGEFGAAERVIHLGLSPGRGIGSGRVRSR